MDDATARRAMLGIWLLSAAMLALELALTRLLALAQFYHFAFMVVSLALLGIGASGTLLSVRPAWARQPAVGAVGFGLAALLCLVVLRVLPFDSYAVAWDHRESVALVASLIACTAPFLCAGLVIGGQLARDRRGLHRVYAANLVGSACGSLGALPLLVALGGEGTLLVSAAAGLVAAGLLAEDRVLRDRPALPVGLLGGSLALLALAASRPTWLSVTLSPYKPLSQVLLATGARHTFSAWDLAGRVDVVESGSIHVLPGLSEQAPLALPPVQAGLTLDGDNLAPITALAPEDRDARTLARFVPEAVIEALLPGARRLVLNPGGGWSVLLSLAAGAERVTVVERSRAAADVLTGPYAAFSHGVYRDPRVRLVVAEPRAFLAHGTQSFDAIVFSLRDSFHPITSGAFSLTEDYDYTVEGMAAAVDRLSPHGVVVVTRWLQTPPTESVRALANLVAALRHRGVERPGEHLAAFRSLRTVTLLASPMPLDDTRRSAVRRFAAERGYDLVWLSDVTAAELNRFQQVPDPADARAFAALLADPDGFARAYPYDVRPTTDDRPFCHHFFRWRQTPAVIAGLGRTWQPFGGSGYLVLVALLLVVICLAVALVLVPLACGSSRRGAVPRGRVLWRVLVYFAALGVGYVFVVIPLSQRFILYLGQAVTALGAVLAAALLFAGLGSLAAPRCRPRPILALLVLMIVVTPWLVGRLFDTTLTWPFPARLALAVLSLAPLGVLLGIPFARGLLHFAAAAPGVTPWAWAVNGCAAVVAGILAPMLALGWGFTVVLWCGAAAYGCGLVAVGRSTITAPGG